MRTNLCHLFGRLGRLSAGVALMSALSLTCRGAEPASGPALLADLQSFRQMGSVLYIAAHPDDENTQLITYLARGRRYRTAYLSLTRGDGGQNVLGPEFGEELGVIRTQELLAARRLDGGRQFFTRAIDFGFSKDYKETLRIWDRQEVLADVVRVIRTFEPDVLVTRFSPRPGGTHGHHTSSAVLALEAFKLAGDPKAFPEQLRTLRPWQPKRIFWNGFFRGGDESADTNVLRMDISGEDPVLGENFGDIAGRSRSMHKTQGFGNYNGGAGRGPRMESFVLLAGEPAGKDIMDGVDTTWSRVPGGADVGRMLDELISGFQTNAPEASVPALLKVRNTLAKLPNEPIVNEKRQQLDHILQGCLGLSVKTTVAQAEVVPGETMHLREEASVRSTTTPVRWVAVRYPLTGKEDKVGADLKQAEAVTRESTQTLPVNTPLTQPYWLREDHSIGMYKVADPALIGTPENAPAFPVEQVFEVGGQRMVVADQPVQLVAGATPAMAERRLDVIPPVSLTFASDVQLFAPGSKQNVAVEIVAARAGTVGNLKLTAPAGWQVTPAQQQFRLNAVGDKTQLTFSITASAHPETALIGAVADVHGHEFNTRRIELAYPHIPRQLLQPPARLKAVALELAIRGHKVGYVPGAGDNVAESLQDMGYEVTKLAGTDLTPERLKEFDALVFGVRAFNVRTDLSQRMEAVFGFVENGGNVIVQYNRPEGLKASPIAPFELHLSGQRVTDEDSKVTLVTPEHPALNTPNKITDADFSGWVQERGLYFPDRWDEHFTPLIACSDPGEEPLKGGLLVAKHGRGYYVYTGLAWFRQLPAGVPGAYRFFANLVSLGKSETAAATAPTP